MELHQAAAVGLGSESGNGVHVKLGIQPLAVPENGVDAEANLISNLRYHITVVG